MKDGGVSGLICGGNGGFIGKREKQAPELDDVSLLNVGRSQDPWSRGENVVLHADPLDDPEDLPLFDALAFRKRRAFSKRKYAYPLR